MYNCEQVVTRQSKEGPNKTTAPAPVMKASGTMSRSDQRCGQKRRAGDASVFGDVVGPGPTGNDDEASLNGVATTRKSGGRAFMFRTGSKRPRIVQKVAGEAGRRGGGEAKIKNRERTKVHRDQAHVGT